MIFSGECYGFREMDEEHEDEMLRFQVSREWVFKFQFQGNGFFLVSEGMGFQFQGNGFWVGCWGRTRG